MSLGTITKVTGEGGAPSAPLFIDVFQFAGDGNYPTGGTTSFKAKLQAITKDGRTPLAVVGQDCGGYTPVYDVANDKLKVFRTGAINAAQEEVPNGANLGAVTFNILVFSQ